MSSSLPIGGHSALNLTKFYLDTQTVKTVQKLTPKQEGTDNHFGNTALNPIWIDISLFIGCLVETRNYRILSLAFILSLKRI